MARKPHKYTRKLQFDLNTQEKIIQRDGQCIFCKMGYPTEGATWLDTTVMDIMHLPGKESGAIWILRK